MSSRKVVQLEDFGDELKGFSKLSLEKKRKAVIAGIARSIPMLTERSPVDTGLYAASWDMMLTDLSVIVGNYAPYAGVIEYGARPFTPPIGPLLAWAKRVTQSDSQPPKYDKQCWALAIYVQKKIAQYGMQPKHVMENSISDIIDNIKKELKNV